MAVYLVVEIADYVASKGCDSYGNPVGEPTGDYYVPQGSSGVVIAAFPAESATEACEKAAARKGKPGKFLAIKAEGVQEIGLKAV